MIRSHLMSLVASESAVCSTLQIFGVYSYTRELFEQLIGSNHCLWCAQYDLAPNAPPLTAWANGHLTMLPTL